MKINGFSIKMMVSVAILVGLTACDKINQSNSQNTQKNTVDHHALPDDTHTPTSHTSLPVDHGDKKNLMQQGIWYDPKTKLYWDRCNVGQTWDGETCQGEALKLTWQDAQDYVKQFNNQQAKGGFTDWRVPTIEELSSIRYCSMGWAMAKDGQESMLTEKGRIRVTTIPANHGGEIQMPYQCVDGSKRPTINQQIFPNTKGGFYWSSSHDANFNYAWGVDFYNGSYYYGGKNSSYYVRAVRSD